VYLDDVVVGGWREGKEEERRGGKSKEARREDVRNVIVGRSPTI
jgi:hypothetical protein